MAEQRERYWASADELAQAKADIPPILALLADQAERIAELVECSMITRPAVERLRLAIARYDALTAEMERGELDPESDRELELELELETEEGGDPC